MNTESTRPAGRHPLLNFKAVLIGGIVLFFAVIVVALGLALFREIDGENLRTLIRENQTLKQELARNNARNDGLQIDLNSINSALSKRDHRIRVLQDRYEAQGVEPAQLKRSIKELKYSYDGDLAKRDDRISKLQQSLSDLNNELAQRDQRISELENLVENRK